MPLQMETYDAVLFDLFGTLITERGDAVDGAAALLGAMPPKRWAVVTSCPRGLAQRLIEHSGLPRPPLIVTSDDVQQGKPAPIATFWPRSACARLRSGASSLKTAARASRRASLPE